MDCVLGAGDVNVAMIGKRVYRDGFFLPAAFSLAHAAYTVEKTPCFHETVRLQTLVASNIVNPAMGEGTSATVMSRWRKWQQRMCQWHETSRPRVGI